LTPGENFAPGRQVPGGGEPGHVGADLGDDDRGGDAADAGDLIQPFRCCGERDDYLLDPGVQLGDIGADPVDAGQHLAQQERVMIGEVPGSPARSAG
jgi:hypothetical protein